MSLALNNWALFFFFFFCFFFVLFFFFLGGGGGVGGWGERKGETIAIWLQFMEKNLSSASKCVLWQHIRIGPSLRNRRYNIG